MVKIGSIFDALEDLDADACIKKMFHSAVVQKPAAGRRWIYATHKDSNSTMQDRALAAAVKSLSRKALKRRLPHIGKPSRRRYRQTCQSGH